ncbi:tRNA (adenosine(37)-N6)-dimethylallyltransferase MiaA [Frigidibacter albus]|uniref:tRNA dimethylallyltransferase n=1 Tax=Frigidibacter albus TaxID=1465486 RepID=A0A6L8VEN5_9RHOB|nr:tRNA (adenosine(37)-N6)-dimethylallyltransferase MiaA [Frigidibacter albus]MZQ88042.1 tRNA (adenosine(37)-N6)-dimethylallyltransferase MiaA [Frigidibacter albus]NBE30284.1 tRNA (adenosine(37)-N6)-dimethylallyltransferase MiaA [Frigidibacter albus]
MPVVIAGPTASGKSALALQIAERQGGVIVNADALQVWGCWRVLTARPCAEEEARAPHLLYGHLPRGAEYSVGHWLREVAGVLAGAERPIIVGGTGLYLTALTEGLAEIPAVPAEVRAEADARIVAGRVAAMLAELDDATRARIDVQNPARIQRAWEVQRATGQGLAAWQAATGPALLPPASARLLVLEAGRDWLAERIDRRFRAMLEAGALEEARAVLPDWAPAAPWARAIGAPELIAHLRGEMGLEDAVTAAQASSRQYAKRQRTWFRARMRGWETVAAG